MRVALFITCIADVLYPEVGRHTVELLEKHGCEVTFPQQQTCCGQPAYNSGYHSETKKVAKHMIEVFSDADYVVGPSGSCVAMLREYKHLFEDEPEWEGKAAELGSKAYELTQFLTEVLDVKIEASLPAAATYHKSCHMTRLLGVTDAPAKLLDQVDGLEMRELKNSHDCCGFGGTFSVKMSAISEQMVDEKVKHIQETGADLLIGGDCSCLMNIKGRMQRKGMNIDVKHIAEVLNSEVR